ncbi:MAG: hypothetical protein B6D78_11660 [gamma proteobacterium symbiont of Ctena orbiculata]|nr:MAG: hypothetical protein B6D78_11660 [gamma proteobacterium symbiont of Ctena orbiculata]PVV26875.1 MAG: hypothetical protein B6D79_04900 [gamma proteobacterium symbiont of Ctena orbiculata]
MNEQDSKKQEYQERYRFWSDKKISQLSFHNNLLLTIGISLIGYFWSERSSIYTKLVIDFGAEIDWITTLFLVGIASAFVSVVAGFILSLSRLYDLRITSNIALTRRRAKDKSILLKEEDTSKSGFFKSVRVLVAVTWNYHNYEIKKREIEDTVIFHRKFNDLRQKASDLGISTWGLVKWQTICMFVAFLFFTLTLVLK